MNTRRQLVIVVVVILLVGAIPALAAIANYSAPIEGEVPVSTDQTPTAVVAASTGSELNLVDMWEGDELNITTPEGAMRVSGDPGASFRVAVSDIEGTQTQVTEINAGGNWIELNPADKNRVDVRGDANTLAFADIAVNDGSTDLQVGGTQGGAAELRLHGLSANTDYVLYDPGRDETLGNLTTDSTGTGAGTVDLPDGTQTLEVRTSSSFDAPTLSNPAPTGTITTPPDELAIDVSADSYPVTVEFTLDGSVVNTTTINSSQRVTAPITVGSTGTYDWGVTATDDIGQATSTNESFTLDVPDPSVSNPTPTGNISERPGNISVDVTANAFPADVTVTFDGSTVATRTLSSNGTVTVDVSNETDRLGTYDYAATVTDDLNQTDSLSASFRTPVTLTLREEHKPQTVVNNSSTTLRFFSSDGDIAIEREPTNGTIDMEGLPISPFVVRVETPNHYTRTVYVESIFEQQNAYVLNSTYAPRDTNDAVRSRFIYEDLTGDFPQGDTVILVERALDTNGDNTSEYRSVAGDQWGAAAEYEVILERGVRYRLVLLNEETGARTITGTHTPTEELSQTIRVSGLVQEAAAASGTTGLADLDEENQTIDIAYNDPTGETDQLDVVVETRGGDPIYNETVSGPVKSFGTSVSLNQSQLEQDYVVRFDGGDRHTSAVPVGAGSVAIPFAVPGWLLTLLASMSVTFVGALYGPRTALLGAWAMVFVASGLAMFGWAFSGVGVVVAALIAAGMTLVARSLP